MSSNEIKISGGILCSWDDCEQDGDWKVSLYRECWSASRHGSAKKYLNSTYLGLINLFRDNETSVEWKMDGRRKLEYLNDFLHDVIIKADTPEDACKQADIILLKLSKFKGFI